MAAAVIAPVSIPTGAGNREVIDLGTPILNLQKIENPQASLYACAIRYGSQGVRSIFEKLDLKGATSTYEEINLSDNLIGDDGAMWLAKGLEGNGKLERLYLPRAGIKAEGIGHIGKLIGSLPNIEEVVLSSNICDAEGISSDFKTGLGKNKSLKSLYLAACRIGDKGVASLCDKQLQHHPSLQHLGLAYNRLEAPAAESLNHLLSSNKVLRFLDLSGNSLGPKGAETLVKGLKANRGALKQLSLAQNQIRLQGARALTTHFLSNDGKEIEFLDLRHNLVTYRGMCAIRKEIGKPMSGEEGWLLLFGERQLFINAH